MARKDLLKSLMMPPSTEDATPSDAAPRAPRPSRGAIGAVSQSIADLKSRSITEVPADMIDDAGLTDRLDEDPEGLDALARSIRAHGQQVPVLVRHHANVEGRYEVVYGRRRVAAMKRIRMPVKVMIRNLSDRELVIAQGQENSARKDLTFIEKANFARQMKQAGYERAVICDALHVDKTVISRMLSVAEAIPVDLIRHIGAAPGVGRDRWLALAARIKGHDTGALKSLARGENSDARFEALFTGLERPARPAPCQNPPTRAAARKIAGANGALIGTVLQRSDATVLTLTGKDGFDDWLLQRLEALHRDWRDQQEN